MIALIQSLIKKYRANKLKKEVNKAIDKACSLREKTGRKYLVIMHKGHPIIQTKRNLQTLIRRRYFKKGTTIQDIEKVALFITK